MLKTVKDMYKYASDNSEKLLSNYSADFWNDYRTNYTTYDKLFCRLFRSWFYFLQERDEDISDIVSNFTADVYAHLLLNDKKYSELYRINVLPDDDYSLVNNYDMHEEMDKNTTSNNSNTYGQRIDSDSYGARSDSDSYGARSDSDSFGAQSNSTTNTVAPYNSSSYQPDNQSQESIGTRADSHTKGAQSDSHTKGAQSDTHTKGSESDTLNNTGTEDYELHRYGNIGVMTVTDMLKKHDEYWTVYEFYEKIFRDIARELLMIGG